LRSTANRICDHKRPDENTRFQRPLKCCWCCEEGSNRACSSNCGGSRAAEANRGPIEDHRGPQHPDRGTREEQTRGDGARGCGASSCGSSRGCGSRCCTQGQRRGSSGEARRAGPTRRGGGGRTGDYSCSPQSGPKGEEAPARLAQFPLRLGRSRRAHHPGPLGRIRPYSAERETAASRRLPNH
jgi:hypothetical protein